MVEREVGERLVSDGAHAGKYRCGRGERRRVAQCASNRCEQRLAALLGRRGRGWSRRSRQSRKRREVDDVGRYLGGGTRNAEIGCILWSRIEDAARHRGSFVREI